MKIKLLSKSLIPFVYSSSAGNEFELMIHGLELYNDEDSTVELKEVSLSLCVKSDVVQTTYVSGKRLKNELNENGLFFKRAFTFPEQLSNLFGKSVRKKMDLCTSQKVESKKSAVILNKYFHVKNVCPSALDIEAKYLVLGVEYICKKRFSLKEYKLQNSYGLPLSGDVWALSGPTSGNGHHRSLATQEFGYDFLSLNSKGKTHKGKGLKNTDYHCFKKEILSPCDGIVVKVADGLQDNTDLKCEEKISLKKINKYGLTHVLAGNYIVIKHGDEYSYFCHCFRGSIRVKEGELVKKSDVIALVGNSGNSTAPHLHFHISDGPEFMTSRSLPIKFCNIVVNPFSDGDEPFDFWETRDPIISSIE